MLNCIHKAALLLLAICYSQLSWADNGQLNDEAIAERIAPIGQVEVGPNAGSGPVAPRTGEALYKKFCSACHASGTLNAPKYGDKTAWAPRIAKGEETLHKHAMEGFNQMPAKGTCGNCSDQEITNAIQYMLDSVK